MDTKAQLCPLLQQILTLQVKTIPTIPLAQKQYSTWMFVYYLFYFIYEHVKNPLHGYSFVKVADVYGIFTSSLSI